MPCSLPSNCPKGRRRHLRSRRQQTKDSIALTAYVTEALVVGSKRQTIPAGSILPSANAHLFFNRVCYPPQRGGYMLITISCNTKSRTTLIEIGSQRGIKYSGSSVPTAWSVRRVGSCIAVRLRKKALSTKIDSALCGSRPISRDGIFSVQPPSCFHHEQPLPACNDAPHPRYAR